MTRLTYIVAGREVSTYREAVALSEECGASITRRYTPIEEKIELDEKQKARRKVARV